MAKIKKNTKIKEGSQRKKIKRPLAAEEQLVCEIEPKKKKQSLKVSAKEIKLLIHCYSQQYHIWMHYEIK